VGGWGGGREGQIPIRKEESEAKIYEEPSGDWAFNFFNRQIEGSTKKAKTPAEALRNL